MAHANKSPLVGAPDATLNAHEPVIRAFGVEDDAVCVSEGAEEPRKGKGCAVGVVLGFGQIWSRGVEVL